MGGEKAAIFRAECGPRGSPPRGRGKDFACIFAILALSATGITPAWAGKRQGPTVGLAPIGDHPRVGGEKGGCGLPRLARWGSPPRGRGKAYNPAGHWIRLGITPAWAGKRLHLFFCFGQTKDHPRVGGEKPVAMHSSMMSRGSPPRGRGKDFLVEHWLFSQGITPAWAGKRSEEDPAHAEQKDHPRVGGEKVVKTGKHKGYYLTKGSPPRGRGKALEGVALSAAHGITPAWAGKSSALVYRPLWSRDHPRVGGEKLIPVCRRFPATGSPPRGRGKVGAGYADRGRPGITPAWAGKSYHARYMVIVIRDHPRVGGEKHTVGAHDIMA